jgi:hypothetical protein
MQSSGGGGGVRRLAVIREFMMKPGPSARAPF